MMHNFPGKTIYSVFLFIIVLQAGTGFGQTFRNYDFESKSALWTSKLPIVIDSQEPFSGKGSLRISVPAESTGVINTQHVVGFTPLKAPRARLLRITLHARAIGVDSVPLTMRVLNLYGPGRSPAYQLKTPRGYGDVEFIRTSVGREWKEISQQAVIDPSVRGIKVSIGVGGGKAVTVWFDEITVEVLERGLYLEPTKNHNIFSGRNANLHFRISGAEALRSGEVRLFDEENHQIAEIPLVPGQDHVTIPLPQVGYYAVNARAIYKDDIRTILRTNAAVVGPYLDEVVRRKSPFGLCMASGELIKLSGAWWDRTFFPMNRKDYIEAAKADFPKDRKPKTAFVSTDDRAMVFAMVRQPKWMQNFEKLGLSESKHHYYPAKDWKKFRESMRYIMESIKGPVHYVEVANEPDTSWGGTLKDLIQYHAEMNRAVKSARPGVKFMGPAYCNIRVHKIKKLIDLGLLNHIDILSLHGYVNASEPEGEFIQRIRNLKRYMKSIGKGDFPFINTEYGWTSPPGDWQKPIDELTRARYISRSSILQMAEGVDAFIYFLTLAGEGPTYKAAGYSLIHWDRTPRPPFMAFAHVARVLADVQRPGRCLQLSPTTYLALFRKGAGTLAATWDTVGQDGSFVPKPWTNATDMMGREVAPPRGTTVKVTPSPLYVQIPDASFYDIKVTRPVEVPQGGTTKLPISPIWAAKYFSVSGNRIKASPDAPLGEYSVIARTKKGWRLTPIRVIRLLDIQQVRLDWPLREAKPKLFVKVGSNLSMPVQTKLTCRLGKDREIIERQISLPPNRTIVQNLALPDLQFGRRYQGNVTLDAPGHVPPVRCVEKLDVTVLPCIRCEGTQRNWATAPVVDISRWGAYNNHQKATTLSAEDCSAHLQCLYNDAGLYFRILVRDDVHRQSQFPRMLWAEDCVQVALDLDYNKPLEANVGGRQGHDRVFEYGAALGTSGPMTWRWISYVPELPADVRPEDVKADVIRQGDRTEYRLSFPWRTLGATNRPAPGSRIGFSLLINDVDDGNHHRIHVFDGIARDKDITKFGPLWLR